MPKLIWIETGQPDDAAQLADMLESNGMRAETSRTIRGKAEVRIAKPPFRRMKSFIADLEVVVRRWLAEHAPERRGVIAQTADERFEIRSPAGQRPPSRTRNAAPA